MALIFLSSKDIYELLEKDARILVQKAFVDHANGYMRMPSKVYLNLPEYNGDFRAMPACSRQFAGLKWVNAHPGNSHKNLPAVSAVYILNDAKTGLPLSIMEAGSITSLRTAAAAALSIKMLARKKSKTLAIVGAGGQAYAHILASCKVRKFKEIIIIDPDQKRCYELIERLKKSIKMDHIKTGSLSIDLPRADVIITLTPVRQPVILSDMVSKGTHIAAMGADAAGKQEVATSLLRQTKVYVDDYEQAMHSGEINVPIHTKKFGKTDIQGSLGSLLIGEIKGRSSDEEITLFDSTGLAIQDLALAISAYKKALKLKKGQKLQL